MTAAAHKPNLPPHPWALEFTTTEGTYKRYFGYESKEACEAAMPKTLKDEQGYNGHCIPFENGHLVGSQDPAVK
jgi:hypothetical protein